MSHFNYIITVHNKEALLDRVLSGVGACAGAGARIIVVLDGCTDGSESIARNFAKTAGIETRIIRAPDVHEIKSINLGLRETKPGYCVIVQDDVVIEERRLEALVTDLCDQHCRKLGIISFRLAADMRPVPVLRRLWAAFRFGRAGWLAGAEVCRLIGGPQEHLDVERVGFGVFRERMVGIKSPVCLTPELRLCEPWLDEDFAPYCYDDVDLSLRVLRSGLINGLFPIAFQSNTEWGGTRMDSDFSSAKGDAIRLRNQGLIWAKHFSNIQ
jgi:glycosyltransferase involved in cell wall biosynthesis